MLRSVLGVVVALLVAMLVVVMVESVGHVLYPAPQGVDLEDPAAVAMMVAELPVGALFFVALAWGIGAFIGGWVAARIAGRAPMLHAGIVSGFLAAGAITTMTMVPHPGWFWVAGLGIFPPATLAAARAAGAGAPIG